MTSANQPVEEKQDVRRGLNLLELTNPEHMTIEEFEGYWKRAGSVTEAKALIGLLPHLQILTQNEVGGDYLLTQLDPLEFLLDVAARPAELDSHLREIQKQALRAIGTFLNKEGAIDRVSPDLHNPLTLKVAEVAEAWTKDEHGAGDGHRGVRALLSLSMKNLERMMVDDYNWYWRLWDNPCHHTEKDHTEREICLSPVRQRLVNLALDCEVFSFFYETNPITAPVVEAIAIYMRFALPDLPLDGVPDDPWEMCHSDPIIKYKARLRNRTSCSCVPCGSEDVLDKLKFLQLLEVTADKAQHHKEWLALPKDQLDADDRPVLR